MLFTLVTVNFMAKKTNKKSFSLTLRNYFIAGVVVLIPIGFTLYLTKILIGISSNLIPKNINPTHINLNDNTLAGFECKNYDVFSVQYHPESSPGPHDSRYLFDQFTQLMRNAKKN